MNSNLSDRTKKCLQNFLALTYLHEEDERNGVEAGKTEEEAAASNKMVVALQASMGVLERSGTLMDGMGSTSTYLDVCRI
jgi:hypothetical protein